MNIARLDALPLKLSLRLQRRRNLARLARQRSEFGEHGDTWPPTSGIYLRAEIHPFAQLGHQVASWMSGYLWAKDLGVRFAGGAVTKDPDGIFNLSIHQHEPPSTAVSVKLPAVLDERNPESLSILRGHLRRRSHPDRTMLAHLALDQARWDQTRAEETLRSSVAAGRFGHLLVPDTAYIAVHVRRASFAGDISVEDSHRWIDADWYASVVDRVRRVPAYRDMPVRIFSTGSEDELGRLRELDNAELVLGGTVPSDFLQLCAASVLVASPSSFSFNAGLVSTNPVLVRSPWWHHVPDEGRWFRVTGEGEFDSTRLSSFPLGSDTSEVAR